MRISVCDSINDALERERNIAYAIEQWSASERRWHLLREIPPSQFCKPYPLGILKGETRIVWLWPGQRLTTGFIAAQAISGVHLGDRLRFALAPFQARRDVKVNTKPFKVDQVPTESDINLRIAH